MPDSKRKSKKAIQYRKSELGEPVEPAVISQGPPLIGNEFVSKPKKFSSHSNSSLVPGTVQYGKPLVPKPQPVFPDRTKTPAPEKELDTPVKRGTINLNTLGKKPRIPRSVLIKKAALRLLVVTSTFAVIGAAYFGVRVYQTAQNVIDGESRGSAVLQAIDEDISPDLLAQEGDGRVNVLLVGIRGEDTDGAFDYTVKEQQIDLADTIIVATIDTKTREAGLFSIPRDLFVDIPGFGSARINNATRWGEANGAPGDGIKLLTETIEQNLNIPLHYYVQVDLEGFVQTVDTVGGVDVYNPQTIIDYEFSFEELGYAPPFVLEAGNHTLDGTTALAYIRSRKTSPRGDFDRNDRQRDVLLTLKDEVISNDTYFDPLRISNLLSVLSGNVRTSLQIDEIVSLSQITREIPNESYRSAGISTDADSFLRGTNIDGASVLVPRSGNFTEVTSYFFELFPDRFIEEEKPTVAVYNSSFIAGRATEVAAELSQFGYDVTTIDTANVTRSGIGVYSGIDTKPYTRNYLQKRFDTVVEPTAGLPLEIGNSADFVVVIGQ